MNDVAFSMRLVNTDTKLRIYQPLMRLATWVQDCVSLPSGFVIRMNDVAFLMRLVNTDTKLRNMSSGSIACMNDVASLMRLVNTGIELHNHLCSKLLYYPHERCSIFNAFSE